MLRNPIIPIVTLLLIVAVALAASLLFRSENGTSPAVRASPENSPQQVLRFGHNIPEDSALHQAAARFAALIAERTGNRVRIDVYPAQALGTDDQMLEMARLGELDMLLTPTAKISVAVPAMQYADLPFYFPTREDLYEMLDGQPGQILLDRLRDIDLVGVAFWENGFKQFTGNHPLRHPDDFAGMDVRIMKSRLLMEQFKAFGAHTIPIDFHATRQALADGVVDGQENPLIAIASMGIHEVQSHLTLSNHGYLGYVFMISEKVFNTLPPELQDLLLATARELTAWERDETHRRENALLEQIRASGVHIHELNEDERQAFAQATAHIPARFEAQLGPDLMSLTEERLFRKYGPHDTLLIALDADLSQECTAAGLGFKRGIMLALEEINAAGGVLGRPLRLIARDNRGMAHVGLANQAEFAADPRVVAMVAGVQASVVVEQARQARQLGLPLLVAWSADAQVLAPQPAGDPVFRLSGNDRLIGPFLTDHLLVIASRPAILYENSVWGRGNLDIMQAHLRERGADLPFAQAFNRGDLQPGAMIEALHRSGADSVMLIAPPREGGEIMRELAHQRIELPVITHWGLSCGDLWQQQRRTLARVNPSVFQTFSFIDSPRPAARALAENYLLRYGLASVREIAAPQAVAQSHDLMHLLARAIEQAGSTERTHIVHALEHLPRHAGAVRDYRPAFSPQRHDALDRTDYHLARFAADGVLERMPSATLPTIAPPPPPVDDLRRQ
jgi:tripartite ATP-independent transporter DctP family solute receptor